MRLKILSLGMPEPKLGRRPNLVIIAVLGFSLGVFVGIGIFGFIVHRMISSVANFIGHVL